MRHDRHLEEPPEHPDDCDCRECTHPERDRVAVEIMRYGFDRNPHNDTHLCSGGPEEITDDEWERWRQERSAQIERMAEAGCMPGPDDDGP